MDSLKKQLRNSSRRFYTVIPGDDENFEFNLFPAGIPYLTKNLFELNSENADKSKNFLIPGELSLEIDGIAGITPGDVFQTDYIPEVYTIERGGQPATFFQTFEVTQKVSSDGWSTEFNGKMRVNTEAIKSLIGPTAIPEVPDKIIDIENINSALEEFQNEAIEKAERLVYKVNSTVVGTKDYVAAAGEAVFDKAGKIIKDPKSEFQKALGAIEDLSEEKFDEAYEQYKKLEKDVKSKGVVKGVWSYGKELFK